MRAALAVAALLALGAAPAAHAGEWLAGDFHVHSVYSHDSWGGPGSGDTNTDPLGHPQPGSACERTSL